MLYLLDANTLIDAEAYYYGFEQVPQFWTWLQRQCEAGQIKMPFEIWQEIQGARGALGAWVNDPAIRDVLVLAEQPDRALVQAVLDHAYAPDLSDAEIEQIGGDPFLAAYALVATSERVVVTKEVSKPRRQRANRKLPDACAFMNVHCMDDFTLYRTLGFRAG